jgi:hypothetical protein
MFEKMLNISSHDVNANQSHNEWLSSRTHTTTNVGEDVEKNELPCTVLGI